MAKGPAHKFDSSKQFMQKVHSMFPKFEDVFDEETFYICAIVVVIVTIIIAFILSRYITLKDPDDPHRD